jgi:hypothetical protein
MRTIEIGFKCGTVVTVHADRVTVKAEKGKLTDIIFARPDAKLKFVDYSGIDYVLEIKDANDEDD